jgi:hypothetical protein
VCFLDCLKIEVKHKGYGYFKEKDYDFADADFGGDTVMSPLPWNLSEAYCFLQEYLSLGT